MRPVFFLAQAAVGDVTIRPGNTVVVHGDKVPAPAPVRDGWKNGLEANLANEAGLPAAPLRTDDLPLTTQPKKLPEEPPCAPTAYSLRPSAV